MHSADIARLSPIELDRADRASAVPTLRLRDRITTIAELTAGRFEGRLRDLLGEVMRERGGLGSAHILPTRTHVADSTRKLLIRNRAGQPSAVFLCSAPAAPRLVRRAMEAKRQAREILGPELGAPVPLPLCTGELRGCSFAIVPHYRTLSDHRLIWIYQRLRLAPGLLGWLRDATRATCHDPTPVQVQREFLEPLRHMASCDDLGGDLAAAARRAMDRLAAGTWKPACVLAHNDLWRGNILLNPERKPAGAAGAYSRFVLIDWAGARPHGHGIFDLVRLGQCLRISGRRMRQELHEHCRILGCEVADAECHLMASLAWLGAHLEHFPRERYIPLARVCHQTLRQAMR